MISGIRRILFVLLNVYSHIYIYICILRPIRVYILCRSIAYRFILLEFKWEIGEEKMKKKCFKNILSKNILYHLFKIK